MLIFNHTFKLFKSIVVNDQGYFRLNDHIKRTLFKSTKTRFLPSFNFNINDICYGTINMIIPHELRSYCYIAGDILTLYNKICFPCSPCFIIGSKRKCEKKLNGLKII